MMMAFQRNPGHLPDACAILDQDGNVSGYRRVHVRLFGGWDSKHQGHAPWPSADTRPSTNWQIGQPPHPFDINEYEVQ